MLAAALSQAQVNLDAGDNLDADDSIAPICQPNFDTSESDAAKTAARDGETMDDAVAEAGAVGETTTTTDSFNSGTIDVSQKRREFDSETTCRIEKGTLQ